MQSALYAEAYVLQAQKGSLTDAVVVALIEIRAAIEENTGVQRDMHRETLQARNELGELLEKIRPLIETVEAHDHVLSPLTALLDELLAGQAQQAALLRELRGRIMSPHEIAEFERQMPTGDRGDADRADGPGGPA